jgi:hypothetical protein
LFIHALKNAHKDVFLEFITIADGFLRSVVDSVDDHSFTHKIMIASWHRTVGNSARFLHNPPSSPPVDTKTVTVKLPVEFIVNTIWVALKLCGLVHDIGHLPMSHSFEDAVKDINDVCYLFALDKSLVSRIQEHKSSSYVECFSPDRDIDSALVRLSGLIGLPESEIKSGLQSLALHERRSFRILDIIKRNPINVYDPADAKYRDLVFLIAEIILLSTKRNALSIRSNSLLAALRDIVAGGLDADRLDYTLRDPRSSGLELGVFDIDRIVTNATLCRVGDRLQLAFADNCISAIESFFHQRYLVYSALIYHRTVVRAKAILRELLARLMVFAYRNPGHAATDILEANYIVSRNEVGSHLWEISGLLPSSDRSLGGFDDARLRTMFFDLLGVLTALPVKQKSDNSNEIMMIIILLETFLFRKRGNWLSPGKSIAAGKALTSALGISDVDPFILGEQGIKNSFQDIMALKRREIQNEFDGRVCMVVSQLSPRVYNKADAKEGKVYVTTRGKVEAVPIEDMSSFMSFQHEILRRDMDYAISFVGENIRMEPTKSQIEAVFNDILKQIADIKRKAMSMA